MKQTATPDTNAKNPYEKPERCADCTHWFTKRCAKQVRCPACQYRHKRAQKKRMYIRENP